MTLQKSSVLASFALAPVLATLVACDEEKPDRGHGDDPKKDPPIDCSLLQPVPGTFTSIYGFTGSEDFAFDTSGRVISSNVDGTLVRQTQDGTMQPIAPNVGGTAGMAYLPHGDLMVNVVDSGTLIRVHSNGSYDVVVSGIAYPNGLTVDLDGFVYVAEHDGARVRRVDPDSGEYTVIANGLVNPNGLAFSPDYETLYVGSFGGGTVTAIPRGPNEGEFLPWFVIFRSPNGPPDPCDGLVVGDDCTTISGETGTCTRTDNGLSCVIQPPCEGKDAGDPCQNLWGNGSCSDVAGTLYCALFDDCLNLAPGDACSADWIPEGVCEVQLEHYIVCAEPPPCENKAEGDACTSFGTPGVCQAAIEGHLECLPVDPCSGKAAGDSCDTWDALPGECYDSGAGFLECGMLDDCAAKAVDDACTTYWEEVGICIDTNGYVHCEVPTACTNKQPGDACTEVDFEGTCEYSDGWFHCQPLGPCSGKQAGDACLDWQELDGVCTDNGFGLDCLPPGPCAEKAEGDSCEQDTVAGTCQDQGGVLACVPPPPCDGKAEDDACDAFSFPGHCMDVGGNQLECVAEGSGGGLDGLGVDGCGNVYVTEYVLGKIWRIRNDDNRTIELFLSLPSSWIPNLHWGKGVGGWERDVLYIMDRDEGRIFAAPTGVPGIPEPYPAP